MKHQALFSIVLLAVLVYGGCASISDAGAAYFKRGSNLAGVEPPELVLKRMREDQKMRDIIYGKFKAAKVLQCTLLRNQLYVAATVKKNDLAIEEAVIMMEAAYQSNDEAFISTCDQILTTELGREFARIQQEYLATHR